MLVHLPEPARLKLELSLTHRFSNRAALGLAREYEHFSTGCPKNIDVESRASARRFVQRRRCGHRRGRQGKIRDRDDAMRAGRERTNRAVLRHVQAHPRAPSCAVSVAGQRLYLHTGGEVRHALQRTIKHTPLQLALVIEVDMPELGTTSTLLRGLVDGGRRPHVVSAVLGCVKYFHGICTPKLCLRIIRDDGTHRLPGDGIRNKNHAAIVASHHDATVGYVGNLQLQKLTSVLTHPPSLGATVPGAASRRTAAQGTAAREPTSRLYLASTSPARLATLRAAGIEPVVMPSDVDEDAAVAAAVAAAAAAGGPLTPSEMVLLLARVKAEAVALSVSDGFVLGGDSAFELDGAVYGKPHTASVARERWLMQRGRTGVLHSGHWLIDRREDQPGGSTGGSAGGSAGNSAGAVSSASVTFASDISDAEIDAYIATGEPLKVAGAFTIDSLGAPFITTIKGDPHAVVGLSLSTLRSLLRGFGVEWHEMWKPKLP